MSVPQTTILIVEDHPDVLGILDLWLSSQGFAVLTAQDGAAALSVLDQYHPDLILTDLMMPRMDGLELIRRVRELEAFTETPIIVMSADAGAISQAEGSGVVATICKPLDFDCLLAEIKRVLSIRSNQQATQGFHPRLVLAST